MTMWAIGYPRKIRIRSQPSKHSSLMRTVNCGDEIRLTGMSERGWSQVEPDGWIRNDNLTDQMERFTPGKRFFATGQTMGRYSPKCSSCVEISKGEILRGTFKSGDWIVTDKGMVKAEHLKEVIK